MQLREQIIFLRSLKKEGTYWDFKKQHHTDNTELLHDIMCLANAEHNGDRFLIYGIEDETMALHNIANDKGRRPQANIIDFLRSNQTKFSEGRYPDIRLETLEIDCHQIDVLIISEPIKKPIYLVGRIDGVNPYHIYSRVGDTNTPKDKSASPHDIERMWRERFGLDQTPFQRVQAFLADFDDWASDLQASGSTLWYHKVFPEFTIRVENSDLASSEEWTRGEIVTANNHSSLYTIYYHQTRIGWVRSVTFDDNKKSMVAPEWESCATGRFYFYEKDSIGLAMQLFHAHHNGGDHSKKLTSKGGRIEIPVITQEEVSQFLNTRKSHDYHEVCPNPEEQYKIFLDNHSAFLEWQKKETG